MGYLPTDLRADLPTGYETLNFKKAVSFRVNTSYR
jgi:hypothetical protein